MVQPRYDSETLADALAYVREARADNRDHYVHLRDLRLEVASSLPAPHHEQLALACTDDGVPDRIALREESLARLARFCGLPAQFGEALPASMVASNFNYVLRSRADDLVLLRLRHQEGRASLRAVLPAAHVRIDDAEVVEQLRRMPGSGDLSLAHLDIQEDRLHLRLLAPRTVDVGRADQRDPVHPGIDIYNSETGAGRLGVVQCMYRVVCANGLIFRHDANATRWRHARGDRERLRAQLAETLRLAVAETNQLTTRYRELHGQPLRAPAESLAVFMREYRLGSPRGRVGERILLELGRTGDLFGRSAFDFVQAVTAVARTLDTERRRRFEAAAGELVRRGGDRRLNA
jgi:hypothetical protein